MYLQDASQKSILHFFSPKQFASKKNWKTASENDTIDTTVRHTRDISTVNNRRDKAHTEYHSEIETSVVATELDSLTPASKRIRVDASLANSRKDQSVWRNSSHSLDNVIVIESDGDDDFVDHKAATKSCKIHSNSSKKRKRSKVISSATSPRYRLEALFDNTRKKDILRENDDIDNEKTPIQRVSKDSKTRVSSKTYEESEKKVEVNSERTAGVTLEGNVDEIWNCKQCTYLNHKALNYCEMCESPKKYIAVSKTTLSDRRGTKSGKINSSAVKMKVVESRKELKEADSVTVTDAPIDVSRITDNSQDDDGENDNIDFELGRDIDDAGNCGEVIAECVEMESDTDHGIDIEEIEETMEDDYTIDECCSPSSDGIHEVHCNSEQIQVCEENSHSAPDVPSDSSGKTDDERSPYSEVDGVSSNEHVQSVDGLSSSCYFNKTGITTPCQVRKKEIVIENTLNIMTYANKQQNGAETMCNNETVQIECKTDTPISGRKYRFKSVRRNKAFLGQAVVSSPCSNSDQVHKTDENFSSRDTSLVKCAKSEDVHDENIGTREGCVKLGNSETSNDIVRPSKTEPVSSDHSFSSPGVDLLAVDTDNGSVDGKYKY